MEQVCVHHCLRVLLTERDACQLHASSTFELKRGVAERESFVERTAIFRLLDIPDTAEDNSIHIKNIVPMIEDRYTDIVKVWELVCANFIKFDLSVRQALVNQWAYHWHSRSEYIISDPRRRTLASPSENFHFIKGQWEEYVEYESDVRHPYGFFLSTYGQYL